MKFEKQALRDKTEIVEKNEPGKNRVRYVLFGGCTRVVDVAATRTYRPDVRIRFDVSVSRSAVGVWSLYHFSVNSGKASRRFEVIKHRAQSDNTAWNGVNDFAYAVGRPHAPRTESRTISEICLHMCTFLYIYTIVNNAYFDKLSESINNSARSDGNYLYIYLYIIKRTRSTRVGTINIVYASENIDRRFPFRYCFSPI